MKLLYFRSNLGTASEYVVITEAEEKEWADHARPGFDLAAVADLTIIRGNANSIPTDTALNA